MRREVSLFFRQLAATTRAGIPLAQGLRMASEGCQSPVLEAAVEDVGRRVQRGSPLGSALAAHPEIFQPVEMALVAVGEENGRLDINLQRLAERSEKSHHDRQRLVFALLYPAGLFLAALFLPKLYVWVRDSFTAYLLSVFSTALPFLAILGLLAAGFRFFRRASPESFDRILLELPVLGPNLEKLALARFSESLSMLYAGGVELRKSLRLSVRALGNRYLESRCRPLDDILERKGTISQGLRAAGVFPAEFVNTVTVGETTGDLDRALESLARLYQEEAERAIQALLKLLPIVVYLLVALYIALIVISAFGAYFRLLGSI